MAASQVPTPASFAENFREVIRIGFNWDRFFEEQWQIELVTLNSPSALARCFMPWYIGTKGDEVAYDDHGAVPMSLTDVPKAMKILNAERQADLQQYVDSFRRQGGVIEFAAPTYALPDNRYFVLDGNHRLSALTLVAVPFEVTLWNVCGPLHPECLLDLIHWHPEAKTQAG